jgi:hypothetical protein
MASDADEDDDLSYFSNNEILIHEKDEVDDIFFDEQLMDSTEIAPTPKKVKGTKNKKSPLKKSPKEDSNLAPNAIYLTTSQSDLVTVDEGNHLLRRPTMTVMMIKQSIFGTQAGCGISQLMNVK